MKTYAFILLPKYILRFRKMNTFFAKCFKTVIDFPICDNIGLISLGNGRQLFHMKTLHSNEIAAMLEFPQT